MPICKHCGKEFNRDRDTKSFCRATCRSLYRYHKNKKDGISVQKKKVSVTDLEEEEELIEEITYDDSDTNTRAEDWNPEENI